jgi:hypothetical protein
VEVDGAAAEGPGLGNWVIDKIPVGSAASTCDARRHAAVAKKERADQYSANIMPVIREIQASE